MVKSLSWPWANYFHDFESYLFDIELYYEKAFFISVFVKLRITLHFLRCADKCKLPEEIEAAMSAAAATTSAQPPSTSGLVRSSVNRIKNEHSNYSKYITGTRITIEKQRLLQV